MSGIRSERPRESYFVVAALCIVLVALIIVFTDFSQSGIENCPTCTTTGQTTYCNGNELTYCGGGLPLLTFLISLLSLVTLLFAVAVTWGIRRPGTPRPDRRWSGLTLSPAENLQVGALFGFVEGESLVLIGLLMPILLPFCGGECGGVPYVVSGVPLLLVVVGGVLFAVGAGLLLLQLGRAFAQRSARVRANP